MQIKYILFMRKTYGPLKAKKCSKGLRCGGTCISRANNCLMSLSTRVGEEVSKTVSRVKDNTSKKKESRKTSSSTDPFSINARAEYEGYASEKEIASFISEDLGVSDSEAQNMVRSVRVFTKPGGNYSAIRKQDMEGEQTEVTKGLNDFLDKSPIYDGPIYRGLSLSPEQRDKFLRDFENNGYEIEAISSFASKKESAENYANSNGGLVIEVSRNKSGSSLGPLGSIPDENEVLVQKGTKYRKIGQEEREGITYLRLEEVDTGKFSRSSEPVNIRKRKETSENFDIDEGEDLDDLDFGL